MNHGSDNFQNGLCNVRDDNKNFGGMNDTFINCDKSRQVILINL